MNDRERIPNSKGIKVISLLLILGGCLGMALAGNLQVQFLTNPANSLASPTVAIFGAFIVIFGWAAWTGRDLWVGNRRALTRAKILFGIQIPVLQVPGFAYEFHTGLMAGIKMSSGPRLNFGFNLGSSFTFYISAQVRDVAIGINLVAVLVLIYLMRISRPQVPAPDRLGLI